MRFSLDVPVQRREIKDEAMRLELPIMPPSTNNLYCNVPGAGRVKTQRYRDWLNTCGMILRSQVTGRLGGRVDILIRLEDSHPTRDASNCIKPLEDLLVKVGAIANDNAKHVRKISAEWAPIKGVEIQINRVAA
jgi:Holliday junction resolvase RusA-like endonuclease